jgi:hypothetical protein
MSVSVGEHSAKSMLSLHSFETYASVLGLEFGVCLGASCLKLE